MTNAHLNVDLTPLGRANTRIAALEATQEELKAALRHVLGVDAQGYPTPYGHPEHVSLGDSFYEAKSLLSRLQSPEGT